MDPASLLEQLAPLRAPQPVGWWPLAPGWWLLLALSIAGLMLIARWAWHKWQGNRYRRLALQNLDHLTSSGAPTLEQLNVLLKATALQCWPREQVAALHGRDWLRQLADSCPGIDSECFLALERVYQAPHEAAPPELVEGAARWIRQHKAMGMEAST